MSHGPVSEEERRERARKTPSRECRERASAFVIQIVLIIFRSCFFRCASRWPNNRVIVTCHAYAVAKCWKKKRSQQPVNGQRTRQKESRQHRSRWQNYQWLTGCCSGPSEARRGLIAIVQMTTAGEYQCIIMCIVCLNRNYSSNGSSLADCLFIFCSKRSYTYIPISFLGRQERKGLDKIFRHLFLDFT